MLFQNGVLISDNDTRTQVSTAPAISALAKQYAAGTISKDELLEKGYRVLQKDMKLGSLAYSCIMWHAGVNFKDLSACEFDTEPVTYEYLDPIYFLNKDGVDVLLSYLLGKSPRRSDWFIPEYPYSKEEDGTPYITMFRPDENEQLIFPEWTGRIGNSVPVYIKKEDIAIINAKFSEVAKPIMHYIDPKHIIARVENQKSGITSFSNNATENEKILRVLIAIMEKIGKESKKATDGIYVLEGVSNFVNTDNPEYIFFTENSLQELLDLAEKYELKVKEEQAIAEQERINEELRIKALKESKQCLEKAIDFIVTQREAKAIAKSDEFDKYLIFEGENKKKVKDVLKKFCPVVRISIIDMTSDSVVCHWTVEKNNTAFMSSEENIIHNTYELTLKYKDNKLVINNEIFNIDTAKLISSKDANNSRGLGRLY